MQKMLKSVITMTDNTTQTRERSSSMRTRIPCTPDLGK